MTTQIRRAGPCVIALILSAILIAPSLARGEEGSALDQYVENVPAPGGDEPTRDLTHGSHAPLSPAAADALDRLGEAGRNTAALAEATGYGRNHRGGGDADEGSGPIGAVFGELLDPNSGGMGFMLPLILVVALIAGVLYALKDRLGRPGAAS